MSKTVNRLPDPQVARVLVVGGARAHTPAASIAAALAQEGAALAVTARSKGKVQTAQALEDAGAARVVGYAVDGTDADAVARCVQDVEESFGGLDVLVVAGMASVAGVPLARLKAAQLEGAWRTGPAAAFNWLHAAHDALARTRGRAVVCLPPEQCARAAGAAVSCAVAATRALCESARAEWAGEGVSCDVVEMFAETDALARLVREDDAARAAFADACAGRDDVSLEAPEEFGRRVAALLR